MSDTEVNDVTEQFEATSLNWGCGEQTQQLAGYQPWDTATEIRLKRTKSITKEQAIEAEEGAEKYAGFYRKLTSENKAKKQLGKKDLHKFEKKQEADERKKEKGEAVIKNIK
jgi:hypothetical protein